MKIWTLSHGKDGTTVSLDTVPFWAWALQTAGDELCYQIEQATGFCLIDPPQWMWNLRWAKPDEDGYTESCAGHYVHQFGQALLSGFGAWHQEKTIDRLPVSYEWVREHQPESGWPWDGTDRGEDESDGEPGDVGSG